MVAVLVYPDLCFSYSRNTHIIMQLVYINGVYRGYFQMKIKYVAVLVRLLSQLKEFRYIYEENSFALYFNNATLLQIE